MLNYTIGAVKRKKSTSKKKVVAKKGKATKTESVSMISKIRRASTPKKYKTYKVTQTCSDAGKATQKGGDTASSRRGGGILALCRASVKSLKMTEMALKRYGLTRGRLSRKK